MHGKSIAITEIGDRLTKIDMCRKVAAAVPLSVRRAGSPSNTMPPGPRLTSVPSGILVHPAVWAQYTWAENGGCYALWGSWVPILHNVACAEAYLRTKWHLDPSGRLAIIHQRHKTDRQTDRQWSDCIGLNVLQTVAQKSF